ncbi:GntR family transcriptional regulator [Streptomyces sp. NBC_00576]|uniref:GntR family transcriptional regulator n=1 Tax=Streptomyces sp. NBC_00576 TaxID=2903665 RepID=UPI002E80C7CE|nr:GntR family transcriptional regulator [Streptomyces sp. NBC_00576]WUB72479.1 GntR family transcriptional regulator [Streptomyces sp. NBC_00576]
MTGRRTPDGRGKEFWRLSEALRARLADGTYPLGSLLPPQRELAAEFTVSRDTVQRVLRELNNEGWIESRQGSGSRVVKVQQVQSSTRSGQEMTLGPLISEAFKRSEVTLDVYTLTAESMATHLQLQVEEIRAGRIKPERIALRALLPSESLDLPYLRAVNREDTPRLRERLHDIARRSTGSILKSLRELRAEKLVPTVELHIRHVEIAPTWKLYLINEVEALQGLYVPIKRPIVMDTGEEIPALDVLGLGAPLAHFVKDDDPTSQGSRFIQDAQRWFDAMWDHVAEEQSQDTAP